MIHGCYGKLLVLGAITVVLALTEGEVSALPRLRISSVAVFDSGTIDTSAPTLPLIDVVQNVCTYDESNEPDQYEPFFDSSVALRVVNRYPATVKFTRFWYKVELAEGRITTRKLPPAASAEVAPNSSADVVALFLNARDGLKYTTGGSTAISETNGFRAVTFYLSGKVSGGRRVTLRASITNSFDDYDRCE